MTINTRFGASESTDPAQAVAELAALIDGPDIDAVLFFCSPDFDLQALGRALQDTFTCPTIGCTSCGHFGPDGFHPSGILGVAFAGGGIHLRPYLITPLVTYAEQVAVIANDIRATRENDRQLHRFGMLLVDGLSMVEERLVAELYRMVGNLPIIGGSAGDNLNFKHTHVYAGDGRFLSDAAVFALFASEQPVTAFKTQHFAPGPVELVITAADPENRIILEMDGEPAALAYADALGLSLADLTPCVFSRHPLVLTIGGNAYVRSIQKVNEDLSLPCYCAIDEGLIVTIGKALDPLQTITAAFAELHRTMPEPALVIGCDCILRRLEFEQTLIDQDMSKLMVQNRVFGFFTYGEQYNGVHVNQTLTAIAIGG
ncbi:FIST C-terminal domain-containing protein [Methyloversatilis sp. XJ19-13]|uniref:FIST N-terminal domain-containing protein n=1 Tax=Methyloversatilis sp. XJ19-13 TaxID=2963430 RepID=UPI00211CDCAC|nr:FIST N-terminal domain-containing protein [Methyloversatilis sp. XJ19-13]MCQ9372648.1 FIST C-terminal domain-containing protein [Methyloversatilis sp. XJ19-13]